MLKPSFSTIGKRKARELAKRCARCATTDHVKHYETDEWSVDLCASCARETLTPDGPRTKI